MSFRGIIIGFLGLCLLLASCQRRQEERYDAFTPIPVISNETSSSTVALISSLLRGNPNNPEYYYKRSKVYYTVNQYEVALRDAMSAFKLDSANPAYSFLVADIYYAMNAYKESAYYANKAKSLNYTDIDLELLLAKNLYKSANYAVSLQKLREVEKIIGESPELYFYFGSNYAALLDSANSMRYFQVALNDPNFEVQTYNELIKMFRNMYTNRMALVYLRKALNRGLKDESLFSLAADLYEHFEYKDSSLFYHKKVIELNPRNARSCIRVANSHILRSDWESARLLLLDLIVAEPFNQKANFLLGYITEYSANDYEKAKEFYVRAASRDTVGRELASALRRIDFKIRRSLLPVFENFNNDSSGNQVPKNPVDSIQ